MTDDRVELTLKMPKGTLKVRILPLRGDKEPTCKGCGMKIRFAETPRGKTMPVSQDEEFNWSAHFAVCPNAEQFRKK